MRTRARNVADGRSVVLLGRRRSRARPRRVATRARPRPRGRRTPPSAPPVRTEEVGAAGDEVVGAAGHRGTEPAADAVAVDRRARPVARSRTRRAGGRSDPSSDEAQRRPDRPGARRARARASKVARSRTRQIRRRAASGRGRGGPEARRARRASASGCGSRGSCALAVVGLEGALQGDGLLEGRPRGPEQGSAAGGGATRVYRRAASRCATRSRGPSWPREADPLSHIRSRCYVSTPRAAAAGRSRTSPVSLGLDPADAVGDCRAVSTTISTPVDAPVERGGRGS